MHRVIQGIMVGIMKGDTESLAYGSCHDDSSEELPVGGARSLITPWSSIHLNQGIFLKSY